MSETSAGLPAAEPDGPPATPAPIDPGAQASPGAVDAPSPPPPSAEPPASAGEERDGAAAPPRPRRTRTAASDTAGPSGAGPSDAGLSEAGMPDAGTSDGAPGGQGASPSARRRRRRSSSSGSRPAKAEGSDAADPGSPGPGSEAPDGAAAAVAPSADEPAADMSGAEPGAPLRAAAARPKIGDSRPAPAVPAPPPPAAQPRRKPRPAPVPVVVPTPVEGGVALEALRPGSGEDDTAGSAPGGGRSRRRSGRERRGRPVGRYLMCVHVRPHATQIAVLEGRTLVEHYVSRASDDTTQIDGNIYRGRVQNVLPGMEAAFIDIATPKNAVLYRGDVRYDRDDVETSQRSSPRIEEMLRPGQLIMCQVTKNPIGAKGARLTQEVSLPGRFVVMVPNSTAFGISKRLDDNERRRLRRIVDEVRPEGHGLIVRTAAEGASQDELRHDVERLSAQWSAIEAEAARSNAPGLLYREPDLGVRIVREEFNREYRGVVIDHEDLFAQVRDYVGQVNPELVDRVEYYDPVAENLPVFERFHVHEQLHKALDRKVWLPSGGSLIIERTEALTVIDVNTGKNVGKSNLEETVYRNNLEAAEEIARQLRLRDIGGIIVIDFIDMEIRENRDRVAAALRSALSRDKTRTQVFDISELGLVEMTRKRVSEGLVESLSSTCTVCGGRGIVLDETLL